jgi:3D (Asp-Asp-Asp) domain-containing protein
MMRTGLTCSRSFGTAIIIFLCIFGVVLMPLYGGSQKYKSRWLRVKVTAYCAGPCSICGTTGVTSTGHIATGKGVATDPSVIPTGAHLDIAGYGTWIRADDRGGAITGNHIDVRFSNHEEAKKWGTRKRRVRVWEEN